MEYGVEIDVAAVEEAARWQPTAAGESSTVSVEENDWKPSAPHLSVAIPVISDVVEVQVFRSSGGNTLVGAIEFVSPSNQDRLDSRQAFVTKCESLIVAGIGLVGVDIVTRQRANLHQELLERLDENTVFAGTDRNIPIYTAAYHPVQLGEGVKLDIWHEPLEIGSALPTMPLFLKGGPCVRLDLAGTYERTCDEQRIPRG